MAADDSTATTAPVKAPSLVESLLPGILGRAKVVVSPYPFATEEDDSLRITVVNSLPGVIVEVHGRRVTRDGKTAPFRFLMVPTSDRMPSSQDFPLGGGFVTNLSAFASNGAPLVNQTFVIVQIVHGAGGSSFVLGTLLAAAVTTTQPIGWPGTPIQTSIDSSGYLRTIVGTAPAAGVNFNEVVPSGARWRLLMVQAQYAASAAAGNRRPIMVWSQGGGQVGVSAQVVDVGPSGAGTFNWQNGMHLTSAIYPGSNVAGIPNEMLMLAGDFFASQTANMQAGDQWTAPRYTVIEWLEAQ